MKGSVNPEKRRRILAGLARKGKDLMWWMTNLKLFTDKSDKQIMRLTVSMGFIDEEVESCLGEAKDRKHQLALMMINSQHWTLKDWTARMKYNKGLSDKDVIEMAVENGFIGEAVEGCLIDLAYEEEM